MNLNATLLGEMITFAILLGVVYKFVWPAIMGAVETRNKVIADGLAAAERGQQALQDAHVRQEELLSTARSRATENIRDSERRGNELVEAARTEAEREKSRIIDQGRQELEQEREALAREFRERVASLAVLGAEKILRREINVKAHQDLLDSLRKEI